MTALFSNDMGSDSQLASAEDALAWLDDIAELQMSSEASATSGSGLLSTSSLHGASSNPPSTSISSSLSPVSGEDGYASAFSSSSAVGSRNMKKSRIVLDSSQPLTARGKPRARVYVACHECRSRKVRCNGAKPVCHNCHQRDPGIQACNYDAAPKRRGHDKMPGSRARSAGESRASCSSQPHQGAPVGGARSRFQEQCAGPVSSNSRWLHIKPPQANFERILHDFDPASFDPTAPAVYRLPSPPAAGPGDEDEDGHTDELISEPSMQFTRETWWDALVTSYASEDSGVELWNVVLSAEQRRATTQQIFRDLRALFRASIYWASFVHLPRFFETLLDPARRTSIQPGLLLSMLAIGAHVQSSELRQGERGRKRASKLLEKAHAALQASLSSNWVDVGLVQAAWFICYYELQGPPCHDNNRLRSALVLLDSLIRLLSLNSLDAGLPESRFSVFGRTLSVLLNSKDGLRPLFDFVNATGRFRSVFGELAAPPGDDDND
ncbi:hypothetical protein C8T65DRAFT_95798 [Cerioporus squamosus]|nr:hypothetical protein C8T65DRAFT_95798 [Cerioporus squamosus]